jgi:hypothetical protein
MGWRGALLMACTAACAAADADGPRPMAFRGETAAAAVHALVVIADGDAEAVADLPRALFHADVAIPDAGDSDLARRWSLLIPRALARAGAHRDAVVAALDTACRADLAAADPTERAALAEDWLPAPSAAAVLTEEAARAFDHGRLADSLMASTLLGPGDEPRARRDAIATLLSGSGPEVDPALALAAPGLPAPAQVSAPVATTRGLGVAWSVRPGWLLACDGHGRVLWQFRVDLGAEVACGAGAALVRDADGLSVLDEGGLRSTLAPPPGSTRCLAVAGGAAWFATGARAWRLPLSGGEPAALELGEEPLCAPLVRGERSLWLGRREVQLFERGVRVGRIHHFLDVRPGWRLGNDPSHPERPLLISSEGGSWAIEPLASQLAAADAVGRARLLVDAQRCDEALLALKGMPGAESDDGRSIAYSAHVGLGPLHVASHADEVAALAPTPAQAVFVHYCAYAVTLGLANEHFDSITPPVDPRAESQRLVPILRAHPDAVLSWSPEDIAVDHDEWRHASDCATLADALERSLSGASRPRVAEGTPARIVDLLPSPPHLDPDVDETVTDPQLGGAHRYRGALLQLDHASGATSLTSRDAATHRLRWRTRWDSDPGLPTRALSLTGGWAIVAEGPSRLVVLDAGSGERRLIANSAAVTASATRARMLLAPGMAGPLRLAVLGPLDDELALVEAPSDPRFAPPTATGIATRVALPARARWMVAAPPFASAILLLEDGRALLYPGAIEIALPDALRASDPPSVTGEGLLKDGKLYRWID